MTSPRTLREWCRLTCARYPDVEVRNMSGSFRDGLVFCAIIHRHRPDLIDFSSLSKANIYHNNKLAFEIAETKLGIPALLDPNDMVSSREPDGLSIITYVSQYYHFFTWRASAGPVSLKPSHVALLNNLTKGKTPAALRAHKSSSELKHSLVCSLCLKPVHLIQRRWVDGKVYHRSCFRCKVCLSTLLAGSYTRGRDAGFLFCTHHLTESQSPLVDLSPEDQPLCTLQDGYYSLGGWPISSVPHYTKTTESRDGPVCETAVNEGKERDNIELAAGLKRAVQKPARCHRPQHEAGEAEPAPTAADDDTQQEERESCTPPSPRAPLTSGCPVPAPRRMLDPSAVPVPAPRNRPPQNPDGPPPAENENHQEKSFRSSSHTSSSSSSGSPKVRTNHPWLHIVHPGPWTLLPPAPPPVPAPRSRFSKRCGRPRIVPPNPFAEEMDEETKSDFAVAAAPSAGSDGIRAGVSLNPFAEDMAEDTNTKCADIRKLTVADVYVGDDVDVTHKSGDEGVDSLNPFAEYLSEDTKAESANLTPPAGGAAQSVHGGDVSNNSGSSDAVLRSGNTGETPKAGCDAVSVPAEGALAVMLTLQTSSEPVGELNHAGVTGLGASFQNVNEAAAWPRDGSDEAQTYILPRSLSVPAISSSHCHSSSLCGDLTETRGCGQVSSSQSKLVCTENPFNRNHAMSKSKTCQSLPSRRGPAPGHGFPLIRRKVQTDQNVSTEDLRVEMRELDKHLQTLEQRGVQLERTLRDCRSDKEEEQMLTEWFSLVQETNVLVRRDTELVYLTKQQKLEERQADVEYGLRCLLNKPEGEWSDKDRGEEQQLMDELVAIIEQRNQIVSSLDQDRLREREEDSYLRAVMKDKELQKEELRDLKKSKSKFNPSKVFKMLNHKTNDT